MIQQRYAVAFIFIVEYNIYHQFAGCGISEDDIAKPALVFFYIIKLKAIFECEVANGISDLIVYIIEQMTFLNIYNLVENAWGMVSKSVLLCIFSGLPISSLVRKRLLLKVNSSLLR